MQSSNVWAIVLAGGEGTRLRALTTRPCGTSVPKQFCSLHGGHTLIEDAIARAAGVVDASHTCAIVAYQHREWWQRSLERLPARNVFVQPRNRGTGIGVLYSLLHVLALDPQARVLLLPADHYVRDEPLLRQSLRAALACVEHEPTTPVLLGLEPEELDTELGYILPGAPDPLGGQRVGRFIEKPDAQVAQGLIAAGGLWNAFIIAASARALLDLYMQRFASILLEMQVIMSRAALTGLPISAHWATITDMYEGLPDVDFSHHVLEGREDRLRVMRVPPCGWSDLGTPKRVGQAVRQLRVNVRSTSHAAHESHEMLINLAARHAHWERTGAPEARA